MSEVKLKRGEPVERAIRRLKKKLDRERKRIERDRDEQSAAERAEEVAALHHTR